MVTYAGAVGDFLKNNKKYVAGLRIFRNNIDKMNINSDLSKEEKDIFFYIVTKYRKEGYCILDGLRYSIFYDRKQNFWDLKGV
jgi:hypothetical protein